MLHHRGNRAASGRYSSIGLVDEPTAQDRRVAVSWHVPPALHQQIRNLLLSEA